MYWWYFKRNFVWPRSLIIIITETNNTDISCRIYYKKKATELRYYLQLLFFWMPCSELWNVCAFRMRPAVVYNNNPLPTAGCIEWFNDGESCPYSDPRRVGWWWNGVIAHVAVPEVEWEPVMSAEPAAEGGVAALRCAGSRQAELVRPAQWLRGDEVLHPDSPTPGRLYIFYIVLLTLDLIELTNLKQNWIKWNH